MAEESGKLLKLLKLVAPGTPLRSALDQIILSKNGALIVLSDSKEVLSIANGGFEINSDFTPIKLYELAKMDGAIILSKDLSRILRANVHLVPDFSQLTSETGTRQRTAERVARQTGAPVISISEDLGNVFLYLGEVKYILEDIRLLLARSNQALQTLEKYKARLDQVTSNLNALEFEGLVTLSDVATVIQRSGMVMRIAREIERYVIELGQEGRLVKMQLDELIANVEEEYLQTLKDYCRLRGKRTIEGIMGELSQISLEELLDSSNVARMIGYGGGIEVLDKPVMAKGYRILRRIPRLPPLVIDNVVDRFQNLDRIMKASIDELDEVEGVGEVRAKLLQEGLKRLSEISLVEKYI